MANVTTPTTVTPVSVTALGAAGTVTQNFDSLANTAGATSMLLPQGWAFNENGTSPAADGAYAVDTGSSNGGNVYSYGATGSTERAFGTLLSSTLQPTIGAEFVNNTGAAITSLTISYTGEEWRVGAANRTDELDFQYSTTATSLTDTTFTSVTALNYVDTAMAAVGAIDGNANSAAVTGTIGGLSIANGATFWIRWNDFNAAGSDDGLAIDNFSLTANGAAPAMDTTPPTVSSITLGGATPSNATTLSYTVTVSEPVTGVDATDFALATTGAVAGASVTSVTAVSASVYTVTVNDGTGDGTVKLNLADNDSIKDTAGNPLGGTGTTGTGDGSFTTGPAYTVDHTAPTLTASTPANGSTGVAAAANVVLTFGEAVKAGAGSIVLHDVAGVQPDVTISVTDASQVTISGQTVTINPTNDLAGATTYQVQVAAGAVLDAAGNTYAGGNADTFTTAAAAPPPPATSGVLYANNFDTYTAAGLSPGGATAGTLDSNVFMAVGFSDPQPGYGGTVGTGDYGRGGITAASDPSTAGLYSGATAHAGANDHAVLIAPTGAEFDVNGYVELRVQNTTASTVTGLTAAFDWVSHNTGDRSDNLTLSYSVDGVNYTTVAASAFSSPATGDASPVAFVYTNENLTLSNVVVAPGAYLYLHFNHTGSTGSGNRDEVGFDNVNVAFSGTTNVPVLSVGNLSQNEGNSGTTPFTFTINRAGETTGVTTVHYATADGTATAGSDYTALSGDLTFAPGQTSQTVTVQVNGDTVTEGNETFTLNLSTPVNATFQNTAGTATIVNDDNSVTGIADIQGASQTSPLVGQTVNTAGVVTALKAGAGGGFYIQDSLTTGPAGASHGIFVFTNGVNTGVAVGDAVAVTGLVTEYNGGGTNDRPITELNNPTFTVASHNNAVTPVIIGAGGLLPPTTAIAGATYDPVHNGVDFYESLEGQLVTVKNAQAVDTTYSSSTWVVADLGAEATGINARGGITVSATDFNPERIQVYSSALSATMGEHLGDITGYITYYNGEYELIPTAAITPPANSATAPPALPRPTTALHGDATHVSIGAYNVENLGPVEPGVAQATVDARFAQLGRDIAQNLGSPDILGLEEIQDADGEGTGADLSGAATLNKLIAAIAAAGGPTYQYVEIAPTTAGSTGGAPGGNIRSAYLYNPARVSYVAGSAQLISDPNLSDGDAFNNSRKPLAAQFVFNGQTINAIDVHDYARSGSDELFGVDQPPVNSGDQRRVDQTAAVKAYVAQLLAANPAADITVQGDFNGFQFEPTLTQLTHAGGGQLNQLSDLLAPNERYSTTFEGDAQEIDHLLVSDSIDAGAQFDIVHLNTGQPAADQASDHDPIVSVLAVGPQPIATAGQPAIAGATAAQPVNDNATVRPFSTVLVSDTSPNAAETVTVTLSSAANGTLAGGGFTQTSPGVYTAAAASAAAAQAALQALVFTPTANQVAPGQTTSTGFTVTVVDGAASATDMRTTVTTASVNDAPTLGAFQAQATAPADTAVTLQPNVTVTDPDVGATVTGATVAITAPANGDRLAVTAPAGITAAYSAATGVLTLSGAASDAAYQQTLRSVTYLHDGATDPGVRTITFSVTDDQAATTRLSETVSVAGYSQPTNGGGGGGGASVPTNLDIQQAFPTQTSNLLRTSASDPALQTPSSPLYAQAQAEKGIAAQLDSGVISLADAQNALYHLVDGTTSVAEIAYAFFTGKTPTAAGLNYLVHSDADATDLNDPYYAQFTTENRYINLAVSLSTGVGAGAAAFQASYGSLSLSDATAKAYALVFGVAPAAGKVDAILNTQVANGLGGAETRAQYFADISGGSAPAQKAAAIGFLLADSVKEGFGAYQQADLHFLQDLAHGTAVFNVDLLAAYAQTPSLVGQSVADQSLPH